MLLWGLFLRTVVGLHATWLVNSATHSATHLWGSRRFATRDTSTNNWVGALLTFGKGWHNNHHAYPSSARHGLKWYEVDVNWYGIQALKLLGLAKQIQHASSAKSPREGIPIPQGKLIETLFGNRLYRVVAMKWQEGRM